MFLLSISVYAQKNITPHRQFEILEASSGTWAVQDTTSQYSFPFETNKSMTLFVTPYDTANGTDSTRVKLSYQAYNNLLADWVTCATYIFTADSTTVGWDVTASPIHISKKARIKAEGLAGNRKRGYNFINIGFEGVE